MYFTEQMAAFFCKIYTAVGADTYILVALRKNICIHKFNFIPSEHSQYKKKKSNAYLLSNLTDNREVTSHFSFLPWFNFPPLNLTTEPEV